MAGRATGPSENVDNQFLTHPSSNPGTSLPTNPMLGIFRFVAQCVSQCRTAKIFGWSGVVRLKPPPVADFLAHTLTQYHRQRHNRRDDGEKDQRASI